MATKATQERKRVTVTRNGDEGSRLLAFALKALATKTNGQEAAATGTDETESRDLLAAGPFCVKGVVSFEMTGSVGEDTQAPKAYGFDWLAMLSMVLEYAGITRDAARKMLACMVGFERDLRASDQAGKKKPDYAKVTVNAVTFANTAGETVTVEANEVRRLALAAYNRMTELKADGDVFGQTLMAMRPQRGSVTFDSIDITALATNLGLQEAEQVA